MEKNSKWKNPTSNRGEATLSWIAIAQWIRLRLPSCSPGLESQARRLRFYSQNLYYIINKFQ